MELSITKRMHSSGVTFGTSGLRGLVSQMTDEVCFAYVRAFLDVVSLRVPVHRVALGMDLRPSSPAIARACAEAIASCGGDAVNCGTLPTPALALYALSEGIPAVMVSGSHIPFDRNGIKFYNPEGEITKGDEAAIAASRVTWGALDQHIVPGAVNERAASGYIQRFMDFFPTDLLAGLHLGLYEHSSVSRDVFRTILEQLGARVTSLERTEEFVPIDTEAVSQEDIQRGREWAARYGFDAIISTDGDGDRPLLADETGTWLRGDIVGLLCARYLGARHLAVPVSCTTAIEKCGAFEQVVRTRIGSPFVIAGMEALRDSGADSVVGFEANGGFLTGTPSTRQGRNLTPLPTRDAVLPVLAVLATARERKAPVSRLLKELPERYTFSDRLRDVPTSFSRELLAELGRDPAELQRIMTPDGATLARLDTTDGLRATFDNHEIVHLRPSGNAPELRCYCEAHTSERAKALTSVILERIANLNKPDPRDGSS